MANKDDMRYVDARAVAAQLAAALTTLRNRMWGMRFIDMGETDAALAAYKAALAAYNPAPRGAPGYQELAKRGFRPRFL